MRKPSLLKAAKAFDDWFKEFIGRDAYAECVDSDAVKKFRQALKRGEAREARRLARLEQDIQELRARGVS